jgi:cytochrome bd-type quinol oxidase subunit 2
MHSYYFIAGILTFLLGIAHSLFGEYLIFRHYRKGSKFIPTQTTGELRERHLRILWASWHLASILGFGLGAVLIYLAFYVNTALKLVNLLSFSVACSMLAGSLLVAYATKCKHPGWIVLLLIAITIYIGR